MFENPQIRQMNQPKMFRKKSLSDELFLHFSSKVQNLTVFSIIYTIRIRFFGPGELNQMGFSATRYSSQLTLCLSHGTDRCAHCVPSHPGTFRNVRMFHFAKCVHSKMLLREGVKSSRSFATFVCRVSATSGPCNGFVLDSLFSVRRWWRAAFEKLVSQRTQCSWIGTGLLR